MGERFLRHLAPPRRPEVRVRVPGAPKRGQRPALRLRQAAAQQLLLPPSERRHQGAKQRSGSGPKDATRVLHHRRAGTAAATDPPIRAHTDAHTTRNCLQPLAGTDPTAYGQVANDREGRIGEPSSWGVGRHPTYSCIPTQLSTAVVGPVDGTDHRTRTTTHGRESPDDETKVPTHATARDAAADRRTAGRHRDAASATARTNRPRSRCSTTPTSTGPSAMPSPPRRRVLTVLIRRGSRT